MKTKEEILSGWLKNNDYSGKDGVLKAMEEFSEQQSIEFAQWVLETGWMLDDVDNINSFRNYDYENEHSIEEIYQLFLQFKMG